VKKAATMAAPRPAGMDPVSVSCASSPAQAVIQKKRLGRPPVPPDQRAEPTHPRSIRLTDGEWAELQRRGVRGGGSLVEWLAQPAGEA